MSDKIFFFSSVMDVVFSNRKIADFKGHNFFQKIIVIAANVYDFTFLFGAKADNQFKKVAVLFAPAAVFAQLPTVDNVAIKN